MANILIVEDEFIIAADLEARLTGLGHVVCGMASSGAQALELAEQSHPDLVLMDIILDGSMDGVDTAREIRSRFEIPVVFVTAFAENARLSQIKPALPFGYILKPFVDRDLKVTIEMALFVAEADRKRRKVEEDLRRSEANLKKAQAIAHIGSWEFDIQSMRFSTSEEMARIFGYSDVVIDFASWVNFLHPEHKDQVISDFEQAALGQKPYQIEFRIVRADGEIRWIRAQGEVVTDPSGRPARLIGTGLDITENKQNEEALRAQAARCMNLLELVNGVAFSLDPEGRITLISPSAHPPKGLEPGDLLDRTLTALAHPDDRDRVDRTLAQNARGVRTEIQIRIGRKNEYHPVRVRTQPFFCNGRQAGINGLFIPLENPT